MWGQSELIGLMAEPNAPDINSAKEAAPYRVLARKYRPDSFADLIGQEAMVQTLRNAFETGRIPQTWMLTGVRGVGKTTTARILARALNYKTDTQDKPTIALDHEGLDCRAIIDGRHVDVIEMDAASHTGIDDIKQIIDQVRYAPLSARYKVFIIDEVHMISEKAFNALLKTLEEPPAHAKFIFATTEIRKVPVTILSRCQRFDLRRVEGVVLADHLKMIAGKENVEASPEALAMIARAGDGSVRDALSIMDQAIAHSNGHISGETVRDMLGLADRARIIDLFEMVVEGRASDAIAELEAQYNSGADPVTVLEDLANFTHLVTRFRFVDALADDPSLPEDERKRGKAFATALSVPVLSRLWQMLLKGIAEVNLARRPIDAAEMVLVRLCYASNLPGPEGALERVKSGEINRVAHGGSSSSQSSAPTSNGNSSQAVSANNTQAIASNGPSMRLVSNQPNHSQAAAKLIEPDLENETQEAAAAPQAPKVTIRSLADIATLADKNRDVQFKILLKNHVKPVRFAESHIEIMLTEGAPANLQAELSQRLEQWTGARWFVSVAKSGGGRTLGELEREAKEEAENALMADPDIAAVFRVFPKAKITRIIERDAIADGDVDLPEAPLENDDE